MNLSNGTTAPGGQACAYEYTVKRGDSFYLISKRLGVSLRDLIAANPSFNPARLMVGDVLCIPLAESSQQIAQEPQTTPQKGVEPIGDTGYVKGETGTTQGQTGYIKGETGYIKGETGYIKGETGYIKGETGYIKGETGTVQGETGAAEEETAPEEEAPSFTCPLNQRRTVQPGQSISDFQLNAGLNRHTLNVANPNVDLDNLVPGQVICVPEVNQPCPLPTSYILKRSDTLESVAAMFNVSVSALLRANPCLAPSDFLPCVCISLPQ